MTQPTVGEVHVDRPLTNVAVAYLQKQTKFVADRVFPVVPRDKKTDEYTIFNKEYWFRDEADVIAPGGEFPESGFEVSYGTYNCRKYGIAHPTPVEVMANADEVVARFLRGAQWVTQKLLIRRERHFAAQYWKTGVWGADKTGGTDFTKWSDTVNSDPAKDIDAFKREIESKTGMEPNTLVLGRLVYDRLREHPDLKEVFKYTSPGIINLDKLAQYFEIENVYVASAVYDSSQEGATSNMGYILTPDAALLCYAAPEPDIELPSAGYTFAWRFPGSANPRINIERYPDRDRQREIVRGWFYVDMKAVATDLAVFLADAVD